MRISLPKVGKSTNKMLTFIDKNIPMAVKESKLGKML